MKSCRRSRRWRVHRRPRPIRSAKRKAGWLPIDLSRLDETVNGLCAELIDKFPECTRYTKQQTNFWKDLAWHQTIGHARDWLSIHFASWEPLEGMNAFVEKRPPGYRRLRERAAAGQSSEFPYGPYAKTCARCGAKYLPDEFEFCGKCGAALNEK
jgi:hypothetical protein